MGWCWVWETGVEVCQLEYVSVYVYIVGMGV